jgi:hypothetical protein
VAAGGQANPKGASVADDNRDLDEAIRLGIWRAAQEYVEGLFKVYVSPSGGNDTAFANGLSRVREIYLKATAAAAQIEQRDDDA